MRSSATLIDCHALSIHSLSYQYCSTQPPKYTLSRKQRIGADGCAGIGWADEGVAKMVEDDRVCHGGVFNAELLYVFLERRRVANATPQCIINKKRKTVPLDDMGIIDTSLGATSTTEV